MIRVIVTVIVMVGLTVADGSAQAPVAVGHRSTADGTLKIMAVGGSLRVVAWERDSIAVTGTRGPGVERIELTVDGPAGMVRVIPSRSAVQGTVAATVDLEIRVPRATYVGIRTVDAAVDVTGVEGGIDAESELGAIRVTGGATRSVYAETAGGRIDIDLAAKMIRAKSVDGDIDIRRARGFVEVSTVSGDIALEGQWLSQGEVRSVSGNILFAGSFDRGAWSFAFETHGGLIELRVPTDLVADFDVRTLKGRFENALGPSTSGSFRMGTGGPRIRVTSFKGQVRLLELRGS